MVKKIWLILISAIILFVDLLTKYVFQYKSFTLIPKLLFVKYSENFGLVFGWFSKQIFFTIVLPIVIIGIFIYLCLRSKKDYVRVGSTLIIVGILGNLINRIISGFVIDWLYIPIWASRNWSNFNLADISLIVGVIYIAVKVLKED